MNTIENKDGLYDLIGIPETHILYANPGDIVVVNVDANTPEEQMFAYGKKVKDLLPDNTVLVLPRNISMSVFPHNWTKTDVMIAQSQNAE